MTTATYHFTVTRNDVSTNTQLRALEVLDVADAEFPTHLVRMRIVRSSKSWPWVYIPEFEQTVQYRTSSNGAKIWGDLHQGRDYFMEVESKHSTARVKPTLFDGFSTMTVGTGCPPWNYACGQAETEVACSNGTASQSIMLGSGVNTTIRVRVTSESHIGDSYPPNPLISSR